MFIVYIEISIENNFKTPIPQSQALKDRISIIEYAEWEGIYQDHSPTSGPAQDP